MRCLLFIITSIDIKCLQFGKFGHFTMEKSKIMAQWKLQETSHNQITTVSCNAEYVTNNTTRPATGS